MASPRDGDAAQAETREAVLAASDALLGGGDTVAARSSLHPFEDDPLHSCAGLFVSRLNLGSAADVEAAVLECFESLFTESTLLYFAHNGLDLREAAMSVGLQATVDAHASATVFTVDPVTQNETLMYVDAAHGFGGVTNSALIDTGGFFVDKGDPPRIIARRKGRSGAATRARREEASSSCPKRRWGSRVGERFDDVERVVTQAPCRPSRRSRA